MTLFLLIVFVLFTDAITASTINRIVGGSPTIVENYPSIVQVEFYHSDKWTQHCAGSILTSRYVLSAAQCFTGRNSEAPFRRIRAGATYRHVSGRIVYVERVVNHPSYIHKGSDGDISVVRLTNPLPSLSTIQQANIVAQGQILSDNLAVVLAGWGQIYAQGPHSTMLRDITVYTINRRICAQRYAELNTPIIITNNMICSGVLNLGGRGNCQDDAGGPMYYRGIVVGVISGDFDCGNDYWPGVSTSVASYTNWIVATAV